MRVLNMDFDDVALQLEYPATLRLGTPVLQNRGVGNLVQFFDASGKRPADVLSDENVFDKDIWSLIPGHDLNLYQSGRVKGSDMNILNMTIFNKDGVTPYDNVKVLCTPREVRYCDILACGDVRLHEDVKKIKGNAFIRIPKTAKFVYDGTIYSGATGKVIPDRESASKGRRLITFGELLVLFDYLNRNYFKNLDSVWFK